MEHSVSHWEVESENMDGGSTLHFQTDEAIGLMCLVLTSSGQMTHGSDAIQSKDDVVRVAGALTRSSLPTPTRVTVNGEKLS